MRTNLTKGVGTMSWCAPEVKDGTYGHPADIFSFGLIILYTAKLPRPADVSEIKGK